MKVLIGILFAVLLAAVSGQYQRDKDRQIKDQLLGRNYDNSVLPSGENGTGPVVINVSIYIKNIFAVDDLQNNVQTELGIKLRWTDPRLVYSAFPPNSGPDSITLPAVTTSRMWTPEIYIVNGLKEEKGSHYARIILQTGTVQYNYQTKLTTRCKMGLSYYPHDSHTCVVKLSNYGFNDDNIRFQWDDYKDDEENEDTPVMISEDASRSAGFVLSGIATGFCDSATKTGNYSCVMLELHLKREGNYFLIHIYIPCTMLIIMSWLAYWLHPIKSAVPRCAVCVAALSLAVIGVSNFNARAPKTSRTKAIDVWTGITMTFIFTSLIEFVVVNYCGNVGQCPMKCKGKRHVPDGSENADNAEQQTPLNPEGGKNCSGENTATATESGGHKWINCLDVIFRIAIPVLFIIFVVLYWIIFV